MDEVKRAMERREKKRQVFVDGPCSTTDRIEWIIMSKKQYVLSVILA